MTWAFVYVVAILVGLLLWGVTGILGHEAPSPSEVRGLIGRPRLRRGLGVGLAVAGGIGLLGWWRVPMAPLPVLAVALALGTVAGLVAVALFPRPQAPSPTPERAVVVRGMAPGSYGQVRLESPGGSVLMAAFNVDAVELATGSEVVVVDTSRSVVSVRRADRAP